ncbi:2-deoxy-scyllo-inosamine dehydrogenase-like [Pollicipes pollicipes]|nr:2-deoxy-scyllo-inosamine dehydrogenase-like [Pollicipes pollicipes]
MTDEARPAALAAVFDGPAAGLRLQALPLPAPAPREVLVRIVAATVCGSDVHTVRGVRTEPTPSILGHEGVGLVEISRRPGVEPGHLVTFAICDVCGSCDRCATGLSQKCRALMKYGHSTLSSGCGLNGCYSTHLLLRAGTHIVRLPPGLAANPPLAAPANCALATVMCAARAVQTHLAAAPRTRALVQGAGLLGLFACAVLRDELRFEHVFCSDTVA